MDSPSFLETILVAEIRRIEIHLLADWTHHRRFLPTARCPAFAIVLHS